jgi:hypothetical protein
MMDLASGGALEAPAWKVKNLEDYDERLERAARGVDELAKARETAALVVYEAALMKSGRPADEVRRLVREFEETFEDEEEELTIPHASGIMNVEGDEWFFGDESLRTLTGQLLGQFQHRVAQYNYVNEREVLRRWADSYDTRLFIRRRIYETEPIVGVVAGVDLPLIQYLRVAAGGDTVVPSPEIARALVALAALDEESQGDDYAVLAAAENLALRLELPAPIVGEILYALAVENQLEFPEPPSEVRGEQTEEATEVEDGAGAGGTDQESVSPSSDDRAARRAVRQEANRGEEPTRIQDPQAKDAPGVREEAGGQRPTPAPPENEPPEGAPGTQDEGS